VSDWKPAPARTAVYIGERAGKRHLDSAGFAVENYDGGKLTPDQVLVVGPGGGRELAQSKAVIADWLQAGGHFLALGFDQQNADALPVQVTFQRGSTSRPSSG
jgi:hypothetical protein